MAEKMLGERAERRLPLSDAYAQEHAAGADLRHPRRRQRELVRRPVPADLLAVERILPEVMSGSQTTAYLIAVAGALGYFASLILHELGHALVARRLGIEIVGIDLWAFGGLSHMRREPATRRRGAQDRGRRAGGHARAVRCACSRSARSPSSGTVSDVALARSGYRPRPRSRCSAGSASINARAARVQRAARVPARRRAHRARGWSGGAPATATAPRTATGRSGQAFALLRRRCSGCGCSPAATRSSAC